MFGGHGEELPVRVHAAVARDFPGDGSEAGAGGWVVGVVLAAGGEHGVQARTVLLHLGFDVGTSGGVFNAGDCCGVRDGDDQDVAWEGRAEVREGGEGWEGAFGGCEVGFCADGADHVGFALGV